MSAKPPEDLSRLCLHTITTKPWSLEEAAKYYSSAGIHGITVWRDALTDYSPQEGARLLQDYGLAPVSLCRGGFFPARSASGRQQAIDENRTVIDEAAELGAPLVVLVCGSLPGVALPESRKQIRDGIAATLPHAESCGVKLAIEPLHPMYAGDRSAVNTLQQANDMAEHLDSACVGVAVDVYHLWWDPSLETEIARCGKKGNLLAFHICDWKTPTRHLLLDRGIMGEGCIDVPRIRRWVEAAGFSGYNEVEIFSEAYWSQDQNEFLKNVIHAYMNCS